MEKYRTARQRFFAGLVDGLVFLPLGYLDELIFMRANPVWLVLAWLPITYSVVWLYSVLLHYYFGQTVGKRLFGVIVLDNQTQLKITLRQAFLRDIALIVINVLLMLMTFCTTLTNESFNSATFQSVRTGLQYAALIWGISEIATCLFNEKRRALHDFIAGTVVVKTESVKQRFASNTEKF